MTDTGIASFKNVDLSKQILGVRPARLYFLQLWLIKVLLKMFFWLELIFENVDSSLFLVSIQDAFFLNTIVERM